jgi:uncharacterized damage-inducible protein DinB
MDRERADLLEALAAHRGFLRQTLEGMSDEQAASRPTVSGLCLGGLVKHVALVEQRWAMFITEGPSAMAMSEEAYVEHENSFRMLPGETVAGLLEHYARVAAATDDLVRALPSLDLEHPLPEAPWFPPGATRSARRALVHIVGETAQHAGHADIIRETIDGAKTMG